MPNQLDLPLEPTTDPGAAARDAERERYLERLREYLADPEFRAIEGFPIGEDEDILALSDPPYYTACPNPFLPEIVDRWQEEREALRRELGLPVGEEETYHREPYASDVSEGKNNPIYNAHSYHTKVPHKAIMRYILHYTDPGDIVLDGFCGSGMTGVAAQLCADKKAVEELGYRVDEDGVVWDGEERFSRLGARKAVLNDLSPAATFIAYNYNTPVDAKAFEREAKRILREVEEECGWMYETWHPHCDDPNRVKGKIDYTVWSDVFVCPQCGEELVFWDVAVDKESGAVAKTIVCPRCRSEHTKQKMDRAFETVYDRVLGQTSQHARQAPVMISYQVGPRRFEKAPDREDLHLLGEIGERDIPYWFPRDRMPEGDESRRNDITGVTHAHHFYSWRNLWTIAALAHGLRSIGAGRLLLQAQLVNISKMNRYRPGVSFPYNPLSGTLYISSLISEANPFKAYKNKIKRIAAALSQSRSGVAMATQSSTQLATCAGQADYVFVDPPFGGNLMYSALSFLWEAWLGNVTNGSKEAVIDKRRNRDLLEYKHLITACFSQFASHLKAGHWMTVEFHNSRNSIWNAIQDGLQQAGFVVADVRSLDKQLDTFKQVTAGGAVKQDLIISAYKPTDEAERVFRAQAGTPEGAWAFVRQHLAQVPVVAREDGADGVGALQVVAERQDYLLYDRMVAYHLTRGATVPLSAAGFYAGLRDRFVQRDGMFFLPDQVAEYDRARLEGAKVQQLSLFVNDEKSAIQWLRRRLDPALDGTPQTYQEIQPAFLQELHQARHEDLPELRDLLEQNFLQDDAGRYCVPDVTRAGDVERLRTRALLREFEDYVDGSGRLRQFRSEAVRAGFSECYAQRAWDKIIHVAERLPSQALEEDPDLLMYYDHATMMTD